MYSNHIRQKTRGIYMPTIKHWLKMPIQDMNGSVIDDKNKYITHQEYIYFFMRAIKHIVTENGYTIVDENRFKDDITSFIYSLSDNNNGRI